MPVEKFIVHLNHKQKDQLAFQYASNVHVASPRPGPYAYTLMFHEAFGFPVSKALVLNPSVSDRLRRGKLMLEETLETLIKGLGLTVAVRDKQGILCEIPADRITLIHREGDMYDPVETADGIGDINVVANGTAIEFGIPMPSIDHEIFCSNMTKLVDGKPILNRCTRELEDCGNQQAGVECHIPHHLLDPTAPVGKGLKPDTYTPANIARVLMTHVEQFGVE